MVRQFSGPVAGQAEEDEAAAAGVVAVEVSVDLAAEAVEGEVRVEAGETIRKLGD